jgi:RNA polymerase sigma factor (sigma-70 family)
MTNVTDQASSSAVAAELELADKFLAGESDTYTLVDHWIKQVTSLPIWHFIEDSEDVASVVVLKLFANLKAGKFRGESTFRTYVQRIARYSCIDQVRSQRAKRAIDQEDLPKPTTIAGPEEVQEKSEERQVFIKIFKAISPDCQRLWRMIFSECLTYREIGRYLDIPTGSVKRKVHECKQMAMDIKEKLV